MHGPNVAADVALGLNVVGDGTRGVPTANVPTRPGTVRPVAARLTPAQLEAATRALGWHDAPTFEIWGQIAARVADAVVAVEGAASLATGERPGDDAEPTVPGKHATATIEEPA